MPNNLTDFVNVLLNIINALILLIAALSLLVFFRGLTSFIFKSGDAKNNAEGKSAMIRGVVALFIMVALYSIIKVLSLSFGFTKSGFPLLPGGFK